VETVAGTLAGVVGSWGVGLVLFTNPVGWGLAIVLGVGTAVAAYGRGKLVKAGYSDLHNRYGEKVDLVSTTGIDQLCK